VNGYSDKLIAIDDEMVALGRPPPPVVSWLSGGLKGDLKARHEQWRRQVEAWEEANPDAAVTWLELRERYVTQEQLERKLLYDEDQWNYEQLRYFGCPDLVVSALRSQMRETPSWKVARDWMLDTAWSLLLIGNTGCGKSVAAGWAAHQKLMRNFGVRWVDCPQQCERPMYGTEAELQRFHCRTTQVLVIDDLGGGRRERASEPWLAWLDDVLGSRANDGRKTIVTTNRTPDELKAWLGERLVDRLRAGMVHSSAETSLRGRAA
jgi:hypothetical protein